MTLYWLALSAAILTSLAGQVLLKAGAIGDGGFFTQLFRPGKKPYDFDINQVSYNPKRAQAVGFSNSYYDVEQAVVSYKGSKIAGVSLRAPSRMRFQRTPKGGERETEAIELAPRPAYVLSGAARWSWQHMIPPQKELRYSLTFRTLRSGR